MTEKEDIVSKLLNPNNNSKGSILIQEIDSNNDSTTTNDTTIATNNIANTNTDDEGPSILELMMAAQREAKATKDEEVKKDMKKGFGSGFAKGFFNDSNKKKDSKSSKSNNTNASTTTTTTSNSNSTTINVTKKKDDDGKLKDIMKDVKKAMDDDTNPLLKQLQQGDWVTDDLKTAFSKNSIVTNGFSNPKCMAAMELMKTNPNEAKKRFEGDPDVDIFMKEFGRLMSDHFNKLGSKQTTSSSSSTNGSGIQEVKEVKEVGPLQVEAMKRNNYTNTNTTTTMNDNNDVKDSDVSKILNDPELSSMLMDVELQRVLKECEDPMKFQFYMRDPVIARKIEKLWKAGLVGTAK